MINRRNLLLGILAVPLIAKAIQPQTAKPKIVYGRLYPKTYTWRDGARVNGQYIPFNTDDNPMHIKHITIKNYGTTRNAYIELKIGKESFIAPRSLEPNEQIDWYGDLFVKISDLRLRTTYAQLTFDVETL
jgi:hypothetical protein